MLEVDHEGRTLRYGGLVKVFAPPTEVTFENDWIPNTGWLAPTLLTFRLTPALGGTLVEVLGDVVFRLAPINRLEAGDMLRGFRGVRILQALRGAPPADLHALEEVLLRVARMAVDFPEIAELDVNPLLAFPDRAVAVDGRVLLGRS